MNRTGVGDVFRADQAPPGVVGMHGLVGVPRIVDHFGTAVVVGTHGEQILLGKIHHPLGFILIVRCSVGMRPVVEVGEVTVEVDVVAVGASGTGDGVVAAVVGAIRVGAGEDEDVEAVDEIDDARVGAGTQLFDEAEHQYHARHLIAVHGRGVKEPRLAIGLSVIDANA